MKDENLVALRNRDRAASLRLVLRDWHGISVARYENGEPRATLSTIDHGNRRMKFHQLPTPAGDGLVVPWALEALLQAAQEAVLAWGNEQTLF